MQTKIYYNHFYSVSKETFYKPLKVAELQKSLSQVCISLIQLASMNVFYSMWQLEIVFFTQIYCYPGAMSNSEQEKNAKSAERQKNKFSKRIGWKYRLV